MGGIRGTGILVRERSSELLHCRGGIVSGSEGAGDVAVAIEAFGKGPRRGRRGGMEYFASAD